MDPDPITFCDPPTSAHLTARFAERLRLWRERRRWVRELRNAASLDRLDTLLNDTELTRADLDLLVAGPLDAGRQFETLATMAEANLQACPPAELHDALWRCVHCQCRAACKTWLRDGAWRGDGDSRCPNAALLRRH